MSQNDLSGNKPFERHVLSFVRNGYSTRQVFEDFLEATAISICNALSLKDEKREKREQKYLSIVGKYKKELVNLFPMVFADMVSLMEEGVNEHGGDYLGEFFQWQIINGERGQFFTPMPIARVMAKMQREVDPGAKVLDPACGSGRTLLAMLEQQRAINVYGCDLDRRCVLMSAINLFLRGARGYVYRMNSLSLEVYGGYKFNGGEFPYFMELTKDQIRLTEPQKHQIQVAASAKAQQMALF